MNWWCKMLRACRALFRKAKLDREMDEEMRSHIEMRTRANMEAGMPPDEARSAAMRSFGGLEQVKELCRDLRGVGCIEALCGDVRVGLRSLRRNPSFVALSVLTMASGIGANTAIFSFVDRVLLRPLGVYKPQELVQVEYQSAHGTTYATFNYPLYLSYRDEAQVFSGLTAFGMAHPMLSVRGEDAKEVQGVRVSGNYFSVLGVNTVLGRALIPEDEEGAQRVVVISHGCWRRLFGGEPTVIGRSVNVDGQPYTIVGVLGPKFTGLEMGVLPDLYLPIKTWASTHDHDLANRSLVGWRLFGRIKPRLIRDQAQATLRVVAERIRAVEPNNTHPEVLLSDGSRGVRAATPWRMLVVFLATALLLLIACANVATMLLVRTPTRQREIAVRLALGASRGDVIRQLLAESAVLGLLSGGLGVGVADRLCRLLPSLFPSLSGGLAVEVDGRILVFALLVTLVTTVLFGLAPALQLSKPQIVSQLKGGHGQTLPGGGKRLLDILVAGQVAMAVMMLVMGGLLLHSLARWRALDPGFDPARVVAVSADFQGRKYMTTGDRLFFDGLRERLASLPGVRAVSVANAIPLSSRPWMVGAKSIERHELAPGEKPQWNFGLVSPGYFQTLGVPFLRGRDFSAQDGPGAPRVMVVNDVLAQQYWPNQDPIGKRVTFPDFFGTGEGTREVIGVVKSCKLVSILDKPMPLMFWPLAEGEWTSLKWSPVLLARTEGNPRPLVAALYKELVAAGLTANSLDLRTIAQRQAALLLPQSNTTQVLAGLGLWGLWLAALGLYGVIGLAVSQRVREIGIRMALGAQSGSVLRLVLKEGMKLAIAGLGIGVAGALGLSRVVRRLLFGITPADPATFGLVIVLVGVVALMACWLPARRATHLDPMAALRYE